MEISLSLVKELRDAMDALQKVYDQRDAMTREANELMIQEHNIRAQIQRINVDIVSVRREG